MNKGSGWWRLKFGVIAGLVISIYGRGVWALWQEEPGWALLAGGCMAFYVIVAGLILRDVENF